MTRKISKTPNIFLYLCLLILLNSIVVSCQFGNEKIRQRQLFCDGWKFHLGDVAESKNFNFNDSSWRTLDLPHDWSIEGEFSESNPATTGGGALPGGIGWYRKTFTVPESDKDKLVFIEFDGIYRDSEVWINGKYLGKRPNGYISFQYNLTDFLNYGIEKNVIAVRVDNSQQPNSRWYSGSGIYRNVWLTKTNKLHVDHWGTFITTPEISKSSAIVKIKTIVRNEDKQSHNFTLKTEIRKDKISALAEQTTATTVERDSVVEIIQEIQLKNPDLWSIEKTNLYTVVQSIGCDGIICDDYVSTFGIRSFEFNPEKGFILNGKQVKIKGVCNHHDLGCLGTAINTRAIERQLEILKKMGCNGIRTSHNPPAPELLDLCDRMGFIVMDEAFDMWEKEKTEFDYHLDFKKWHRRDLEDMILRDRNHPSIFMWSIGNEVIEQWDKEDNNGERIAKQLSAIVKNLDITRPVTAACNDADSKNPVLLSGALDLIGYNYSHKKYSNIPKQFPNRPFIASETESVISTRGHYDMPSDSMRIWPKAWDIPFTDGNPDFTCSSYDNCVVPWGANHEETWKIIKKYDFISGSYIWTGFDYIGEPTPYPWPARSSYFGLIDLAGFPKDGYYFYQSEWTDQPMLHIFPHWNWKEGQKIDVIAYTNCEEVELFLNGKSMGTKTKTKDNLHPAWRLIYKPGTIKTVGRTQGKTILTKEIKTAGKAAKILLQADRNRIAADGKDLSFVTIKVVDENNILVPNADNLIRFNIQGEGKLIGVDNGLQTSLESFKADFRKAFNGMCLAVLQSTRKTGTIELEASSEGLDKTKIIINTK